MSIPNSAVPDIYRIAQRVYEKELRAAAGARWLEENHGVAINATTPYIRNFKHMMRGEEFKWTMNYFSVHYYFTRFFQEYNVATLQNALRALMSHIIYYEGENHSRSLGMREIYHQFMEHLPSDVQDEFEQDDLVDEESTTSRANLIEYLKNLKKTDDDHVMVNGRSYKRDNKTLSVIKKLRGFACQLCGTILKRNGKFYIEAAHIKARSQSGRETPDNILILCPNHHKEFDHGTNEITFQNADVVEFTMNEVSYSVSLVIE